MFKPAAFEPGKCKASTLSEIKHSGFRVVILMAYNQDTVAVASSAQREQMDAGWAWILVEETSTSAVALKQGWLYLRPFLLSEGMMAFVKQVREYTKSSFNITVAADAVDLTYSVALHDAIMLYAHAATKLLSEGGDLHDGQAVTEAVRNTTFVGAGGEVVVLDERGDRVQSYEVMNYVVGVATGFYNASTYLHEGTE